MSEDNIYEWASYANPAPHDWDDENETLGVAPCTDLLPGLPEAWYRQSLLVEVGFESPPNCCTYRKLFEEYTRSTLQAVVDTVFADTNRPIFAYYRFRVKDLIPLYPWYVIWPLFRKGREEDHYVIDRCSAYRGLYCKSSDRGYIERSRFEQFSEVWQGKPDCTLFEIGNEPRGIYGFTRTLTLRAGGRTKEEARANWLQCASVLRPYARAHNANANADTNHSS